MVGMLCVVAGLGLLFQAPYSTSWFVTLPQALAERSPADATKPFGGLPFAGDEYDAAAALEPFREVFDAHCRGRSGVDAAACASNVLTVRSPFGNPSTEYVDPGYDPAVALQRLLAGEPSHCVPLSSAVTTLLLSAGIPARFVSITNGTDFGHNLVEVWDSTRWLLYDPSLGGTYVSGGKALGAADLRDIAELSLDPMGVQPVGVFPESMILGRVAALNQTRILQ
ncbi:MAG: transglutaminase-like domain-containing protein [Acidimicrobiia bacterium]